MKQLPIILLLISFRFVLFSQDTKLTQETVEFIIQTYNIPESNPIHNEESVLINSIFKTMLLDYFEIKNSEVFYSTDYIFKLLLQNAISEYEDSPDIRRMKMRRSICFSSIALKTELLSSFTFIDHAKYSIMYECPNNIESLLETEYCGLLFFELLLKSKRTYYYSGEDLQIIRKFISDNQNNIDSSIINKAEYLLKEFEKVE